MILLEDTSYGNTELVAESAGDKKKYFIRGVFARSEIVNENKRYYSRRVLEKALNESMESCKNGSMVGELDHPASPKINVERISHKINNIRMDKDGQIVGEAEVLDTPHGMILQKLYEGNVRLGISSRGFGTVAPNAKGLNEVQDNYKLVTFDIVVNPSAGTFPGAVLEGTEYQVWDLDSLVREMFGK
jgi:hypothetical protein